MPASEVLKHLPAPLALELSQNAEYPRAEELRIRSNAPVMFYAEGCEYITEFIPDAKAVGSIVLSLAEHSLTAFADELRSGFFTAEGGLRVGVAGRVVGEGGKVRFMRDFTSLNIRFPRQVTGVCNALSDDISINGRLLSTLIISAPQHGKTTLLRDVVRAASAGDGLSPHKCAVIDERGELSGSGGFDLGIRTDVLSCCPKAEGMGMALRSLSPDVIATDEIGSGAELEALLEAGNSGICVLATAHAGSLAELNERIFFRRLCESGLIKRIVLLSDSLGRSTAERVYSGDGSLICGLPRRLCGGKNAV